jgi:hypothetical protein
VSAEDGTVFRVGAGLFHDRTGREPRAGWADAPKVTIGVDEFNILNRISWRI